MYKVVSGVVEPVGSTGTLLQYYGGEENYEFQDDRYIFNIDGGINPDAPRTLPFDFKFFGSTFTQPYFNSNTYLTFGIPDPENPTFGYAPIPKGDPNSNDILVPGIYINGRDNSWQQCFETPSSNSYRFRYEGTNYTSGTIGEPNIVYEITFYKQQNPTDDIYVQIVTGIFVTTDGIWGIANGVAGEGGIYIDFNTLTPETGLIGDSPALAPDNSYVLRFTPDGTFKNLYAGYHIEDTPSPGPTPTPTSSTNTTALVLFLVVIFVSIIAVIIVTTNMLPFYTFQLAGIAFLTILAMTIAFLILI